MASNKPISLNDEDFYELFCPDNLKDCKLEEKDWGAKIQWLENSTHIIDFLMMRRGEETSKHYHQIKRNKLFCVFGKVKITFYNDDGTEKYFYLGPMEVGRSLEILPNQEHKIQALQNSFLVELDYQKIFRDDIVRKG